jgi:hypothetical protein
MRKMKDEKNIKWLNGELSNQEIDDLKKSEDALVLENCIIPHLQAPAIDAQKRFKSVLTNLSSRKEPKVIPLNYKSSSR